MTRLTIVSNLTILPEMGKMDLGDQELNVLTIGKVKDTITSMYDDINIHQQNLWWRGYILDNDKLPLIKACVGETYITLYSLSIRSRLYFT